MRTEFAQAIVALFERQKELVFITGDLGYMALEGVRDALGERFINAGVAEQNAVSIAAGLAREGQRPWVYSMAAFSVLRPYAQIRDLVCLHRLPVKLVGNGGGYGYGIMGATHHALEDVGALRVLPNMRLYVPLLARDVSEVVSLMATDPEPGYVRLNLGAELPGELDRFAPWRKVKAGRGAVVIVLGPVLQGLYEMDDSALIDELEIWSVGMFPLQRLPDELVSSIREKGRLLTLEEHYGPCGLGEALSHLLLSSGVHPSTFTSLHAIGYPSGRYGSQRWHQEENGLRGAALRARVEAALGV